ncbi:thiamine phosphate synthase [Mesonia sp. K7]|uniref:thiamine phosphate synthase n=1 Tax=Mesonia sp. K7 TaxID=2218606 RepID=UPI000DA7CC51|nr:thiamine phosphate synthase [Mesonia sp. K7]PZD78108.1 thiamine phosphate synthase [Mesonia sp. K7]
MIEKLQYISHGETPVQHIEAIKLACKHGVNWVQLRLKDQSEHVCLHTAKKVREITQKYSVKLIINDHYKIAKDVEADGVHLGKSDFCPVVARQYLGEKFIIGGTANTIDDCKRLIAKKVDYIGLGPYKFTTTKKNLSPILGLSGYQKIKNQLGESIPMIAIGGITLEDVSPLLETGVYGIAVSGVITYDFSTITHFKKKLYSYERHPSNCR